MSADSIEKIADEIETHGYHKLAARLRALPSLAELERDAARYRWLRDHYHGFEHYRAMKHNPNAIRDAIDEQIAARAKEPKP